MGCSTGGTPARVIRLASLVVGLLVTGPAVAGTLPPEDLVSWSRSGGIAAVMVWGVSRWDYFQRDPHTTSEGWFAAGTDDGGADKFGHLFTAYALGQGLGGLYENAGMPRDEAAREAALSGLLILGAMEIGDSFSPTYGFSAEDQVMNLLGSLAAYQLHRAGPWRRRIDLRIEYLPSGDADPFTDYQHNKFLLALLLEGFDRLERTPLAWLELQVGYYARGYGSEAEPDSRHLYVGIGLNLPRLLRHAGWRRMARPFHFWQPPHSTLTFDHALGH